MASFLFKVEATATLVTGEKQELRFTQCVSGVTTERAARDALAAVCVERVHDDGGDMTDAPMESLSIDRAERV